ncbi:lysosomal-trafficking regulator isoform X2 [Leptopilina boulardi]|uniref:lysosomal-trafficking regulator isoform X2 n=1 Tax=Leptopilina boulardi TaxID=63433 RepID=UPI0021F62E4F|nr:lysosomal-trafficking regulator isoform X2 [Leptopilina boulardi]
MATRLSSKLQILWEFFIHAEPRSNEKSSWLHVFLAELLIEVKNGIDIQDLISYFSIGVNGVSTLIACELLSDVHSICTSGGNENELLVLRKYLVHNRGWKCLTVLNLLGIRGISCGQELMALLLALYPVTFQNTTDFISPNPYVKFRCNNEIDSINFFCHVIKKNTKIKHILNSNLSRRKRMKKYDSSTVKQNQIRKRLYVTRDTHKAVISESEELSDGNRQKKSLALNFQLKTMDYSNLTCIFFSESNRECKLNYTHDIVSFRTSRNETFQDFMNEQVKAVFDSRVSHFDTSLLILQLLEDLRDYEFPTENTSLKQILEFALDILWGLQFKTDANLTNLECGRLKAATSRLILTFLQRILKSQVLMTAMINSGLLPMTLRILEDTCRNSFSDATPEERSYLREFIFALVYGVISFLHDKLHQANLTKNFTDFIELFQLFTDTLNGKLIEKTIMLLLDCDRPASEIRAGKIIDMIGVLINALKKVRQELYYVDKESQKPENANAHHHYSDIFGSPFRNESIDNSIQSQVCFISFLSKTLISLLAEAHTFEKNFQIKLLRVMTNSGICCCFPPVTFIYNVIGFLKKTNSQTYNPSTTLLEHVLFKELEANSISLENCDLCNKFKRHHWKFLELYNEILTPNEPKLCSIIIVHLLKVTPTSSFHVKETLLFKVFYTTCLRAIEYFEQDQDNSMVKFLIHASLFIIASLITNASLFEKFMEIDGLKGPLKLLLNPDFTKSAYNLLEVSVIMENCEMRCKYSQNFENINSEAPALSVLLKALDRESVSLIATLETDVKERIVQEGTEPNIICCDDLEDIVNNMFFSNLSKTNEVLHFGSIFAENVLEKKVNVLKTNETCRKIKFDQANIAWRTAANVTLCSSRFQTELLKHPVAKTMEELLKLLSVLVATNKIKDNKNSVQRLLEALITCNSTSALCSSAKMLELKKALMDPTIKLGGGIILLVESLLRVSVLKRNQDKEISQLKRPILPTFISDVTTDCGTDDSSNDEHITGDDGYEADVEIFVNNSHDNSQKGSDASNPVTSLREHIETHPALCSLALDLLIHFSKQGTDAEREHIVTIGLRRIASTCRESVSICAALSSNGAIPRLLDGFNHILESTEPQRKDLQHAILEVFTLLAIQSISSSELISYLSFFKIPDPSLLSLLEPLSRLVLLTKPQPNYILSFPIPMQFELSIKNNNGDSIKTERDVGSVSDVRRRHNLSEICSSSSSPAICLPVFPELSWTVWLHGGSASMWLRVERGHSSNYRSYSPSSNPVPSPNSENLNNCGIAMDNWSQEVLNNKSYFPTSKSIVHLMSVCLKSVALELWTDLKADKLILRLSRPDGKTNRSISETSLNGLLPSGKWHHLAFNFKYTVLSKHDAMVEVVLWIDGWKEVVAQLPFDGLLIRKPETTCIFLGQVGHNEYGAWYLGNLFIFRSPIFTRKKALYFASLGPNYTNLAECTLSNEKPNFLPLITSVALSGVQELKFENRKFDTSRRKSYGGTFLRHASETKSFDETIDWDFVTHATNTQLRDLQNNLLLSYEAQSPLVVHLYPQALSSPEAIVRNILPGQSAFRVTMAPEYRVSQQPPLSVSSTVFTQLESKQCKGLIPAVQQIGGISIFLFLFARVIELNSSEAEQALALSIVLNLAHSDSVLLNQYRSDGIPSLLLQVLESKRCYVGRHMLKAILDSACDSSLFIKDIRNEIHLICHDCNTLITDPELIKYALEAWRIWLKYDTLNLLLQSLLHLLRDQHSQREFNAFQLNRIQFVNTILNLCKEYFLYENLELLDPTAGNTIVELIRSLMGSPPKFSHLVAITDYLLLVHMASNTYVTHSKYNMYFILPAFEKITPHMTKSVTSSNELIKSSKFNKADTNNQIKKGKTRKKEKQREPPHEINTGEDSGIAASDCSNQNEGHKVYTDKRKSCMGLVCEGLLLLLRDALRVLPDSQVDSVLKHVLRAELILVLSNNENARIRTALIKVIQTYIERASDEDINKLIKQKYFMHLANQISLYPGSEPLIVALANLALKGPSFCATPPLLSMMSKTAAKDPNLAQPIISFLTDIIVKNPHSLKIMLEQGLKEALVRSLIHSAHKENSSILSRDINVLFVTIAKQFLESPGYHNMQALTDLHLVLSYVELQEKMNCGKEKLCVSVIRNAQVALFDGELDSLTLKVLNESGFRLKNTASYLASASYLTSVLTTSGEQLDKGLQSSSNESLLETFTSISRELAKGELNDRFRMVLNKAVDFITSGDGVQSEEELQLSKRLFSTLLHGLSDPLGKKSPWGGTWSSRPTLRKISAEILVWLLAPHQNICTRIYAVRILMDEPKVKDILTSLLNIHPQVEQKFIIFLWDLCRREMSSADALICSELRNALNVWGLLKCLDMEGSTFWSEELNLLRQELVKDRNIWIENNFPKMKKISEQFDVIAKQLIESAMSITVSIVEEQNRERKILIENLKTSKAIKAQTMSRWRKLIKRLTHERAPWYFKENYPMHWELDPTEGPSRIRTRLQRCHLDIDKKFFMFDCQKNLSTDKLEGPLSYLFISDQQDTTIATLIERLHTNERINKMSPVSIVMPHAELAGEILIGETRLYFIPDTSDATIQIDITVGGTDLTTGGATAWRLDNILEFHRRRYQLQERAIEIFLVTGRTYLLAFNSSKEREEFVTELSACNLSRRIPGDNLEENLAHWRNGNLTNWDYITCLNKLSGRSYNDLMQYPVFPFVLSDYTSENIDLNKPKIYRNFRKPMAVQDSKNEQHYINNYNYLKQAANEGLNLTALNQEPFHYGSHYSNSGTVLHFLVRLPPYTSMFLSYQDDNFDIPDRTFHALATTWRLTSCDSTTDVKELIPEFFYLPEFLLNTEGFNFGVRQNGIRVTDVELPPWAKNDARLFILVHRAALESDIVRKDLPSWIDLVFGFKQTGKPAVDAINVFHPATYYGFNAEDITDPLERQAWETMVRTYGQTPAQLFKTAHPQQSSNISTSLPPNSIPPVVDGISGIKWGNYVGAPGNDPVLCWKHKHRFPLASLVPLLTGDVFGLPHHTTLLLGYSKEKGRYSANCEGNHPASYTGCKMYKKRLERIFQVRLNKNNNNTLKKPERQVKTVPALDARNYPSLPGTSAATNGNTKRQWNNNGKKEAVTSKSSTHSPIEEELQLFREFAEVTSKLQATFNIRGVNTSANILALGAGLVSWKGNDSIARLKFKKDQAPKPLIKYSGLDPITVMKSIPDSVQLWIGYFSGRIEIYSFVFTSNGNIKFEDAAPVTLLAHKNSVTVIALNRTFNIGISGDADGIVVTWDLNSFTYIRSIVCSAGRPISLISISETLGDFAVSFNVSRNTDNDSSIQSVLKVYTINARNIGTIKSQIKISALSYSNAPEGISVNVIATGLENGIIRFWSSWDLKLVREIINDSKYCGAIVAIVWALEQQHLYAVTDNSTILIWEGTRKLNGGTSKFVNFKSL